MFGIGTPGPAAAVVTVRAVEVVSAAVVVVPEAVPLPVVLLCRKAAGSSEGW